MSVPTVGSSHATGSPADIRQVPADAAVRSAIRLAAPELVVALEPSTPPARETLEVVGGELLGRLELPPDFLGFAMVAVDNAFWAPQFRAIPCDRRLLLLPRCLSSSTSCRGHQEGDRLLCAGCQACGIAAVKRAAETLGYQVIVAEGTSGVVARVLEGAADAVLGVACLESLEKSFDRIADLGVPHQAIPLLTNGCKDTVADWDVLHSALGLCEHPVAGTTRTYLPLLRETRRIFSPHSLTALLDGTDGGGPVGSTHTAAREWLQQGGKRLRPFVTVAAYAVARHGRQVLAPTCDVASLLSPAVSRLAVAIEALHKASLVHDDIEDQDVWRYGQPALHCTYGVEAAINIGDYLVGLGYHLIASQGDELGAECIADILRHLSAAHLQLCRGQGAELMWDRDCARAPTPLDALQIGALKTAPAFEVALYAGLRAAGVAIDESILRRYSTHVGEAYQVLNDLADWDEETEHKGSGGCDVGVCRPTILRAFALEADAEGQLAAALIAAAQPSAPPAAVDRVGELYRSLGAFARAESLYDRLRERALNLASEIGDTALQELMGFLVRTILPVRRAGRAEPR